VANAGWADDVASAGIAVEIESALESIEDSFFA
jgi:hypothetical protein